MSQPVELHRLLPQPGPVRPEEAAAHLLGREVLMLNMVASVDGHSTVDGGSSGIRGGAGDRAVFHALRAHADAILVGTGTLRAEAYGQWIRDDVHRAMRAGAGLTRPPVGATLARLGDVPWDIPLFASDAQVIVYTGAPVDVPAEVSADVEVVVLERADPAAAIADLRARGLRSILCEGGARLNGVLLAAGLVDELQLVIAPQIVGGTDPLTVVQGVLDRDVALTLVAGYQAEDALLLRYRIAPGL
jgi:riboflavin-specific deaminase-like protein